ncbi:MAG: hypothetical protein PHF56_11490 [Desulfuromonadaceae bacterium]|nr:hypothetical protein [Desulfuromonadaceae bacterium]
MKSILLMITAFFLTGCASNKLQTSVEGSPFSLTTEKLVIGVVGYRGDNITPAAAAKELSAILPTAEIKYIVTDEDIPEPTGRLNADFSQALLSLQEKEKLSGVVVITSSIEKMLTGGNRPTGATSGLIKAAYIAGHIGLTLTGNGGVSGNANEMFGTNTTTKQSGAASCNALVYSNYFAVKGKIVIASKSAICTEIYEPVAFTKTSLSMLFGTKQE